jgi:DNA-directed RNA polymerase specialized sigma24 family protein
MSAAYKYMAMEVFAIPTEGDNDADATTHEVKSKVLPTKTGWEPNEEELEFLKERFSKVRDCLDNNRIGDVKAIFDKLDEEEKLFKQRLLKLDTKYRVLIEMKLEGAMDKQIAAKLDCSIPSVSNWFKKACSLLSKS